LLSTSTGLCIHAGGGGKGRLDRGALADSRLDVPLPWDHINTGISKAWLKADLQRALEAATVPDCSHSGLCSKCGVCSDDFGENVVAEPPTIPKFKGHYVPDTRRIQRIRLTFHKLGAMVFVGHLDLMRLVERACRRAALPMSSDASPYNPRTRITYCAPLPLGATSTAEVVELVMTRRCNPADVMARLQAQLPAGMELQHAESFDVYRLNGSLAESLTALTQSITYELTVRQAGPLKPRERAAKQASHCDGDAALADTLDRAEGNRSASGASDQKLSLLPLVKAVNAVRSADEFKFKKQTKKGKHEHVVDLRPQLKRMQVLPKPLESATAKFSAEVLGKVALRSPEPNSWGVIEITLAFNSGVHMRPAHAVQMLSELSGQRFDLCHIHRCALPRFASWLNCQLACLHCPTYSCIVA
jgi:uncharacterized protein (DUF2344 family)